MIASTSPSNGPRISGTLSVVANKNYNIKVEVMATDLDSSSEYVDVELNGNYITKCADGSGITAGGCQWISCYGPSSIQATSSSLSFVLQYSSGVNNFAICSDSGQTGHAVARISLS